MKKLSDTNIDELLIGLAFTSLLAFAMQDFVVLLMYKSMGLTGQSLMSATVIAVFTLIILYTYFYLVPEKIDELIL